ncbi:hypothetical protein [Streptomyces sp. TLI_171]|uniref:hypothetical protein n=1 Tax=Streptomyces sp. TLI_171 TaxID=1938859 RepID=UPI000C19A546|nr:hypothetical protein [Streptomyces sp. TLI_171]RKE05169.1 hypothetical protein BX266_7437 [Streptomyces sp. TLI_171]
MRMSVARALTGVAAVAAVVLPAGTGEAVVAPEHAVIVCQSASFYANYDSASGPVGLVRVLGYGNKVGHTRGVHPVYNGWAATFDFGKGDWGYVRNECLGGYGSW